jgi:hypothetical protein
MACASLSTQFQPCYDAQKWLSAISFQPVAFPKLSESKVRDCLSLALMAEC